MKKAAIIIPALVLMSFLGPRKPPMNELSAYLLGEWIYQYSWVGDQQKQIGFNTHLPVQKLVYSACDDRVALKSLPSTIMNMRLNNALKDLQCKSYNDTTLIDTYFPVARDNSEVIHIQDYGYRYKSDYYITDLTADTLVIYDNTVYTFDEKPYRQVRHVYGRSKAPLSAD